ncbi:ribonuclease P protein component [Helicobacter sp. MIT 14-3879]|uniref:ribonuclease P protein component n=1 Tax=Helicobacter sp. MIT 14-3879 TaxID=2040649 RepID=UPI0015F198D5|nr:ribonuclease P protein component [Helicobacter sp. MIT 14-3879]
MPYDTLKNKKEFDFVYKNSNKIRSDIFDICILKKNFMESFYIKFKKQKNISIVGLSVSKKIGKAVERNLIKRRFRVICAKLCKNVSLRQNLILIIIAKEKIKQTPFFQLEKNILNILLK